MRMPGFMTETSAGAMRAGGSWRPGSYGSGREIIPALPVGGYACLAVAAACRRGDTEACKSVRAECRPYPGNPCGVQQGNQVCKVAYDPVSKTYAITTCWDIPSVLVCDGIVYTV